MKNYDDKSSFNLDKLQREKGYKESKVESSPDEAPRTKTDKELQVLALRYKKNWQKQKILNSQGHQIKAAESLNDLTVKRRYAKKIILADEHDTELTEFASCSYLGLDLDDRVIKASSHKLDETGVNFAVSRTRLRMQQLDILNKLLSEIFCGLSTTLFSSLHITHLGFFPLLASGEMPSFPIKENGPLFIIDKVAHSSMQMQQGMLKLIGDVTRIDFQNHTLLESKFKEAKINNQTPISISDSIISMGGVAPIELLLQFSEKYDGYVYLDDAHGTSIYGKNGCGYTLDILNNNPHPRMIITPSLSKGFGSNCAVLAVPTAKDNEYVRRFCAPYIFSNPPVMASINSSIESAKIHLTDEINFLQKKLWDNVALFDAHIQTGAINLNSKIPIKGIFIGDEKKAIKIALFLKENGFFVTAAMYPTVAKGKSILRIALSASHTESDIVALCNLINSALSEKLS